MPALDLDRLILLALIRGRAIYALDQLYTRLVSELTLIVAN